MLDPGIARVEKSPGPKSGCFLGKLLWSFDLEGVRGHKKSFDKDFKVFMMWERPELYVRFVPIER